MTSFGTRFGTKSGTKYKLRCENGYLILFISVASGQTTCFLMLCFWSNRPFCSTVDDSRQWVDCAIQSVCNCYQVITIGLIRLMWLKLKLRHHDSVDASYLIKTVCAGSATRFLRMLQIAHLEKNFSLYHGVLPVYLHCRLPVQLHSQHNMITKISRWLNERVSVDITANTLCQKSTAKWLPNQNPRVRYSDSLYDGSSLNQNPFWKDLLAQIIGNWHILYRP